MIAYFSECSVLGFKDTHLKKFGLGNNALRWPAILWTIILKLE